MTTPTHILNTIAGQQTPRDASNLGPEVVALLTDILATDKDATRRTGWAWGVRCGAWEAEAGPHLEPIAKAEQNALACAVGHISEATRPGDEVLYGGDLDVFEGAEDAIVELEFAQDERAPALHATLTAAMWAATAGKEAARVAWIQSDED